MRRMIRAMALSDGYQLASTRPDGVDDPATFAWYLERPLTGEQLARSIQLVARGSFKNDENLVKQFRQQIQDVLPDETVVGIDDALFYTNGSALDEFIVSSNAESHLLSQLSDATTDQERIHRLFVTVFGREPTSDEQDVSLAFLAERKSTLPAAMRHMLWSLLMSAEFQFNH